MSSDARGLWVSGRPAAAASKNFSLGTGYECGSQSCTRSCSLTRDADRTSPIEAGVSLPLRLVLGAMPILLLQSAALAHLSHLEASAAEHAGNIHVTPPVSVAKAAARLARVARLRQPDSGKNCKKVGEVL
jgi:hypothetical protein